MSFDGVRQVLNELDIVAKSDKQKAEMERIKQQNLELGHENNRIHDENNRLETKNSELLGKAKLKEAEIQRRAEALAADLWRRWLAEEKPVVVASAVDEEIKHYPISCTDLTRQVIDDKVEQRLQEEMREGWNAIFFGFSNGFKAANRQVATAKPIVIARPIAKARIIRKLDEPK
jgi:hypothetical protein